MCKTIDLSHDLNKDTPVFPGAKLPLFIPTATLEEDGYRELHLSFQSHTGTHIDAPAHLLRDGKSLSDFHLDKFSGKAYVIQHSAEKPITIEQIDKLTDIFKTIDFIIIQTDWNRFWGQDNYFVNFPILKANVLNRLCSFGLKGLGIDAISVDPLNSKTLPNHYTLFSYEMLIIENLTNLSELTNTMFDFYCLPLPITNGDGSPVRAMAQLIN